MESITKHYFVRRRTQPHAVYTDTPCVTIYKSITKSNTIDFGYCWCANSNLIIPNAFAFSITKSPSSWARWNL